jgi:hypothetical protein
MSEEETKRPKSVGEKAKDLFSSVWSWAGRNVAPEFGRLGRQGSMELASALFNGSAFTPYGPGAYTKESKEHGMKTEGAMPVEPATNHEQEQQRERGGRGM